MGREWLVVIACGCLSKPTPQSASNAGVNRAFVSSSQVVPITLGGLGGADAACAAASRRGNLSGTFLAWMSTSTTTAASRFAAVLGGWVGTDGNPFAASYEDLVAGQIFFPIAADESGNPLPEAEYVATGTDDEGRPEPDLMCDDWTGTGTGSASAGVTDGGTSDWTFATFTPCDQPAFIYCLETDLDHDVTPPPAITSASRLAFVTEGGFDASSGYATAANLCATEGATLAPHGPFQPLLAADGKAARDGISVGGRAWQRVDGVTVIDGAGDLSRLLEPINLTANGDYVTSLAFIGADDLVTPGDPARDCNNWSSNGSADEGWVMQSNESGLHVYSEPCTKRSQIFCLED